MTAPGDLGQTATTTPAPSRGRALRRERRRRRPTGGAPPLPRSLGTTGKWWLVALVAFAAMICLLLVSSGARRAVDRVDAAILRQIAQLRTAPLTDVATAIDRVLTGWVFTLTAVGLMVAMIVFRRWRHLFTFLAAIFVMQLVGLVLYNAFTRPRPYDVTAIGRWAGYSSPSPPVVVLAALLVGIIYSLVPPGRARERAKLAIAAVLVVFVFARLYLGVDHPFDAVSGLVIGIAIPLAAFRLFTPNDVTPVAYGSGKTAHLDVGGQRGEAIRRAVHDQLGLTVLDARPVGLEGSGGSTPLRLAVASADANGGDGVPTYLFAKLFAMNHVRADRWYKLGRRILYGRMEDETRFESVRRLVEYEDYTLRLVRDAGIPTATPYGIVEITPEREYMLVASFIDGAAEMGDAEVDVDDAVIDEALGIVRQLWDAGLAHRDIKPANLMVADGRVYLIDAAFAQVRPSPWRQAVDLGNMMLVLAVRTDAPRVYERALAKFTPDDVAEAFAATRGVASPTQLRSMMRQDGRNLVDEFRALAPPRRRIAVQRWSFRRVGLAVGLAVGLIFAVQLSVGMFTPSHDLPSEGTPDCGTGSLTVLVAQAVPSATRVPCIAALPAGWTSETAHVERGRATFWLSSDQGGHRAVKVTLLPRAACNLGRAVPVPSDEPGAERYERPRRLRPLATTRYYLFDGGCVRYDMAFASGAEAELVFDVERALALMPRQRLVDHVQETTGLGLCGAGVVCEG